jgi:hypothetical protein
MSGSRLLSDGTNRAFNRYVTILTLERTQAMAKAKKTRTSGNYRNANAALGSSRRIFDDVLALAGTLAQGRKDLGADKLHSLASLTRDYAASMTDLPNLRVQVASAADSLEGVADYVMHTEIEQMIGDAGTFARRHPLATLAVTVAAGMAASQLMYRKPARASAGSRRKTSPRARSSAGKRGVQTRRSTNGEAHA